MSVQELFQRPRDAVTAGGQPAAVDPEEAARRGSVELPHVVFPLASGSAWFLGTVL